MTKEEQLAYIINSVSEQNEALYKATQSIDEHDANCEERHNNTCNKLDTLIEDTNTLLEDSIEMKQALGTIKDSFSDPAPDSNLGKMNRMLELLTDIQNRRRTQE